MAEPQATPHNETARSKERTQGESRSFDESQSRRTAEQAARGAGEVARAASDGGRQFIEAGAEASRGAAAAWRRSLDPFMALQLDMTRWMDDLWRQATGFDAAPALRFMRPFAPLSPIGFFGTPPADFKETRDAHLISVELPGLKREDVEVALEGDTLAIRGQKLEDNEGASSACRVSERRFGRFERAFPLPPDVDRHGIEAEFRDGLLKIKLPKRPDAAPERSHIEVRG